MRSYAESDVSAMMMIWNEVVSAGNAFPQEEQLDYESACRFFAEQTYCGVCEDNGKVIGMYILHPNNVGRCGHICNASYAVMGEMRGKGVGRMLVSDCIEQAERFGYRVLQFNAVVRTNTAARKLYESLGFEQLGIIRGGFHMSNGEYVDIVPYCYYIADKK